MKTSRLAYLCAALVIAHGAAAQELEQTQEISEAQRIYGSLRWSVGPGTYDVTSFASIELPQGYDRLNADDTRKLMELYQNPAGGEEYYVGPEDERWFAVFSYEDTGHIQDDEEIDADALLESLREGTRMANRERRERGWPEMSIVGWKYRPAYSDATNRLSWAVLAESDGSRIANYNTRLLGRTGVMSAVLVADPQVLDASVAEFEALLDGFDYKPGNTYAEYRSGDKLATYGLAALVTGGAAAAVAKGAGKGLFKAIGLGILAIFAVFGKFIKGLFGKKDSA